jgi:polysaccharide biosynthesis transport protein
MVASDPVALNSGTPAAQVGDVFRSLNATSGPERFRVPGRSKAKPPRSGFAEAFRLLAAQILHPASGRCLQTILIMGANRAEGRTTVAANLGIALAETGRRVALVDADLHQPGLQQLFPTPGGGSADPLSPPGGGRSTDTGFAVTRSDVAGLALVQPRVAAGATADMRTVEQALSALRPLADHIVVDSPPCLRFSDPFFLAPLVDGVLYVVRRRRQDAGAQQAIQQQLSSLGAKVLGVVYNET